MEQRRQRFVTRSGCIAGIVFLGILIAVVYPVFGKFREYMRYQSCDCHLKELATALQLYSKDYDDTLPSSALRQAVRKPKWDPLESARFCAEVGEVPPPSKLRPKDVRWVQVLWKYLRNKDVIWCPSDPTGPSDILFLHFRPKPEEFVTYIYKPAIDRAWFGAAYPVDPEKPEKGPAMKCFRREGDFMFPEDQILLFEKKGWHWGMQSRGWRDGVRINAAFLDGHTLSIDLRNAVDCDVPRSAEELAGVMRKAGEPVWFNYDGRRSTDDAYKGERGVLVDPRVYYDILP